MILLNTVEGDIEFDVTIREEISASNTVTVNPIEFGADVADHNYVNPKVVVAEIGVTNTPIRRLNSFSEFGTRAQNAWEVIQAIKDAGDIFDMQLGLELVENVVIVDISAPYDSQTSNALISRITLQQLFLTEKEEGKLSADQLAAIVNKQAASNKNRGQVERKEVKDQSILLRLSTIGTGG